MESAIASIQARQILDSRGRPTVEAEVITRGGHRGRASVPSGASTGRYEAHELRDGDPEHYSGLGVSLAVRNVVEVIGPAAIGMEVHQQQEVDTMMIRLDGTPDKSRLGANAILAVSLATSRAGARTAGLPLWRYLRPSTPPLLPLPMINAVSGGAHADRALDMQDFLIVPVGATVYSQALEMSGSVLQSLRNLLLARGLTTLRADEGGFGPPLTGNREALDLVMTAIAQAGFVPGRDVAIAIDVAASQLFDPTDNRYHLATEGREYDSGQLIDLLCAWASQYPIVSIEDPLAEDAWDDWPIVTQRLGSRVQIVGDDLFTTSPERLARGIRLGAANAVLIKMNQIGTLTETLDVCRLARDAGYRTIISARSGETEDPFMADLAVAVGAGQIKVGSLTQSERLAKYNQLLRIEEAMAPSPAFATWPR